MKTDEIEKLLPCPFCGGRSEITEDVRLGFTTVDGLHMVQCSECARSDGHVYKTKKAARNSWNTRTPDLAAEVLRLREALKWYGEQARLCRIVHKEGDAGRHALNADGGKRARAALEGRE